MVITAVIALGIDQGSTRRCAPRGAKPVTLLIASIGVTLMIQGLIRLFFGRHLRALQIETERQGASTSSRSAAATSCSPSRSC